MTEPTIALTPGEPAGIGPDVVLAIACEPLPARIVAIADPGLMRQRAAELGLDLQIQIAVEGAVQPHRPGTLQVIEQSLAAPVTAGRLDVNNASYVLDCLRRAVRGCQCGDFDAMVTGPVQKSVIADSGTPFSGHTEFLAEQTGTDKVVMMLAAGDLRVALVTTHLPLKAVPAAITREELSSTLEILWRELRGRFGISQPRIAVLGLNPHAGEGGHLGREEIEVIAPVLEQLRTRGMQLEGPLPADTAFTPPVLARTDALLAMYHDQGLPTLKYAGFGEAINITLGLPIVRTSVDHGTALSLAGSGQANPESLEQAVLAAIAMANPRRGVPQ